MARLSTLRLVRAQLAAWRRTPWVLLLLFAGDLVEIGASIALAALGPPRAPRPPYPAIDVPAVSPTPALGVAMVGVMAGVLMAVTLVAELWVMYRRAQVMRWRRRGGKAVGAPRGRVIADVHRRAQ